MAAHSPCLVLVIDGLGDLPQTELGNRTPLEAARTPTMDRLAAAGRIGLVDPIAPGVVPDTDTGTALLMGMLPGQERLLCRGPVEAAGAGFELHEGDIAFRANFATVQRDGALLRLLDRRAGRITQHTETLAAAVNGLDLGDGVIAHLQATDQHRCVLVLRGPGLDANVGRTDPGDRRMPAAVRRSEPGHPAAFFTASKLNRFVEMAHEVLDAHPANLERSAQGLPPANAIITRGAGAAFRLDSLSRQHGVSTSVVAGCNTVLGMARLFGFAAMTDPRFTADAHTDIGAKLAAGVRALESHPLTFVHFKAPDILAHDRDPVGKRDFIEAIDHELGQLGELTHALLVTADHSTDSSSGSHTADPVPVLYFRPGEDVQAGLGEGGLNFSEAACSDGNQPRLTGSEMLREVIQFVI